MLLCRLCLQQDDETPSANVHGQGRVERDATMEVLFDLAVGVPETCLCRVGCTLMFWEK